MACYHPIKGYRSTEVSKSGKRKLVFNPTKGYVDLPIEVPCGQCIGCRIDRTQSWAARCIHEAQFHEKSCFVTLTYADQNLPPGGTLVKKHFQDFMKRLRKNSGIPVRYFHCGEYGENLSRPHYHAILFGIDFPDKIKHTQNSKGEIIYTSQLLERIWQHGFCTVGPVNYQTAAYTASYIMKKITGEIAAAHYQGRQPEYVTMSLKPGLGTKFFEEFKDDVFPSDYVVINGKQRKVPKFYDRLLEKHHPEFHETVKHARIRRGLDYRSDSTPERLLSRETIAKAKINLKQRKI
nr:MAG: replication initiator protein [Microvirus sp.]